MKFYTYRLFNFNFLIFLKHKGLTTSSTCKQPIKCLKPFSLCLHLSETSVLLLSTKSKAIAYLEA